MNLLLTSGGVRNAQLSAELFGLAGASAGALNCTFIPTAASVRDEDKRWLIDDLVRVSALGFARLDIADLAALTPGQATARLEQAHVLVFGGGSTAFLLEQVAAKLGGGLTRLLETRVLVGISAGSVMCCPYVSPAKEPGLGLVDFLFVPHMNSPFASRTREDVQGFATALGRRAYWADDGAGVLVRAGEVRIVGAGSVEIIEP